MASSSQRIAELENQLAETNNGIYERVKMVASRKTRIQLMKDELKTKDQAIRQLEDYFNLVYEITHPDARCKLPPNMGTPEPLVVVEDLHKKPNPVLEAKITAELRAQLSLNSQEPQRKEYDGIDGKMDSKLVEIIAQLEAELALSVRKLADLDNMSASDLEEEKHLESEIEHRDQLLKELDDGAVKINEIEESLLAKLAELDKITNQIRIVD